jgi:hypothetical protein
MVAIRSRVPRDLRGDGVSNGAMLNDALSKAVPHACETARQSVGTVCPDRAARGLDVTRERAERIE